MQTLQNILQLFYGSEANSHKPLKNEKISGIERLSLPFPDKISMSTFTS